MSTCEEDAGGTWRPMLLPAAAALLYLLPPWGPQWGDGLEFAAVSAHLGVAHPPGYPLFTLLGNWTQALGGLAGIGPYASMLALCKLAALGALLFFFRAAVELHECRGWMNWTAGLAAMVLACSGAVWGAAAIVEVYGLLTFFLLASVSLSVRAILRPEHAIPWVLGASILGGAAAATHLTGLAILPMLLQAWCIQLRQPGINARANAAACALIFVNIPGLFYASLLGRLVDPLGEAYGIFWGAPKNASDLLDHVRGGEYRQFQFLMAAPGTPFTLQSWLGFAFNRVLLLWQASGSFLVGFGAGGYLLGFVVIGLVKLGAWRCWKAGGLLHPATGLVGVLALLLGFLFLYNIPDILDYLLPVYALAMLLAVGGVQQAAELMESRFIHHDTKEQEAEEIRFSVRKLTIAALACLVVATGLVNFRRTHAPAATRAALTRDWQAALLAHVPANAAVITSGDADIYTIWYGQFALGATSLPVAYGSNFNRFPWFRATMPPGDPRRDAVQFRPGPPPRSMQEHLARLREDAIDPMLQHGPVFFLPAHPGEAQGLQNHYQVLPTAQLLSDAELERLMAVGAINVPPPMLYEIRPR